MKMGSAILVSFILGLGALSNAYADYTYATLDYSTAPGTIAQGMNNAGTIVGSYATGDVPYAFSSSSGSSTSLGGYPGAVGIDTVHFVYWQGSRYK